MNDLIDRQEAIEALKKDKASLDHIIRGMSAYDVRLDAYVSQRNQVDCDIDTINNLPTAQPERLTDDDFETIRIHLSAIKGNLCNQHRWKEAEEYQRIIDRFMSFAIAQPMRKKGKWIADNYGNTICSECRWYAPKIMQGSLTTRKLEYYKSDFCWKCGADMRGDPNE